MSWATEIIRFMTIQPFSLIVATDMNRGIGAQGSLPWRLKGDMKHFRETTIGNGNNAVVMGRKTWESIPGKFRPLPDRNNIVLTRRSDYIAPEGVQISHGLTEAIEMASGADKIFVIGGAEVYASAMQNDQCKEMILTLVDGMFACDAFLAPYDKAFSRTEALGGFKESGVSYRIERWLRID